MSPKRGHAVLYCYYAIVGWRSSGVEQLICNQPVRGSNPFASSKEPLHDIRRCMPRFALFEAKGEASPGRAQGQVGEWLIPTDCKSVAPWGYGGSNPPLSTRVFVA